MDTSLCKVQYDKVLSFIGMIEFSQYDKFSALQARREIKMTMRYHHAFAKKN